MRGRLSPCLAQTRERALPKADPVPGRGTVPIVGKMLWKKPVIACWLSKTDLSSDADLSLRGALSAPILHTGHLRLEALLKMTQRGEPAFLTPGPAFYTHIHLGPAGSASSHGHPFLCRWVFTCIPLSSPVPEPCPLCTQIKRGRSICANTEQVKNVRCRVDGMERHQVCIMKGVRCTGELIYPQNNSGETGSW